MAIYGNATLTDPRNSMGKGARNEPIDEMLSRLENYGRTTYGLRPQNHVRKFVNDMDPNVLSTGGALLGVDPPTLLQIGMTQTDVIRANAEIVPSEGNFGAIVPTIDGTDNMGCVITQGTPSTSQDSQTGRRLFSPRTYSSDRMIISRVLETDGVRLMPGVLVSLGHQLGRRQNYDWTVGVQNGIVNMAGVGVTTASSSAIAIDEVLALIGSINAFYRSTASLMMNTATWTALATVKDSSGQYLWRLSGLHKFPLVFNDHMPNIAPGAKPILYGPLSLYKVFDKGQVTIQRFTEEYAENYEVGYEAFLQSDGALADATGNAVKTLQMAAT